MCFFILQNYHTDKFQFEEPIRNEQQQLGKPHDFNFISHKKEELPQVQFLFCFSVSLLIVIYNFKKSGLLFPIDKHLLFHFRPPPVAVTCLKGVDGVLHVQSTLLVADGIKCII